MRESLRGAVFAKFRTVSAFAKELGWNRNKAARIVNGVQEPTPDEMAQMADVLALSKDEFLLIFFAGAFTKWTA